MLSPATCFWTPFFYYHSSFIHQLLQKWIVLKTILKFTLKLTFEQLGHVSVRSHHHQGAYHSCVLKLRLLKLANWNTLVSGVVAAATTPHTNVF
jgi:hypothetical protein